MRDTSSLPQNNVFKAASTQTDALRVLAAISSQMSQLAAQLADSGYDDETLEDLIVKGRARMFATQSQLNAWLTLPDA